MCLSDVLMTSLNKFADLIANDENYQLCPECAVRQVIQVHRADQSILLASPEIKFSYHPEEILYKIL